MSLSKDDKQWIRAELGKLRAALKTDWDRPETALTTELHEDASPAELRARTHAAVLRALELEAISDRATRPEQQQ